MLISIIIKALNEEDCIARSIESALKCIQNYSGEVILADSLSSDATIDIAKRYPIKIVQINNASERRCGIGPQLGYQYAKGEFIYILDADMILDINFLNTSLNYLQKNPGVAGVAGIIDEKSIASYQFKQRKSGLNQQKILLHVDSLDMGGLYRSNAIEDVGFFSDINLHAFEEKELGCRLRKNGWELIRLPIPSVEHYGHELGTIELLKQRWKSKYLTGSGELLRASICQPYMISIIKQQKHVFIGLFILLMIFYTLFNWRMWIYSTAIFLLIVFSLAIKKKNIKSAFISIFIWTVTSIAFLRGFFMKRRDPYKPIDSKILHDMMNK